MLLLLALLGHLTHSVGLVISTKLMFEISGLQHSTNMIELNYVPGLCSKSRSFFANCNLVADLVYYMLNKNQSMNFG